MKQKSFAIGFLVFIFTCTACKTESDSSVEIASADPCDRVCLEGFVDLYLEALVEHDSSKLPLTQNARYTENGQALRMNDGMWQVATAVGDKKLYFADPVSGQVGFRGIVEENGHKQIIITRIKVENRKVSEIEAIVCREGAALHNPEGLNDHPIFTEALAADDRPSREELVQIANSYFEGLEQNRGDITPFDPQCTRMENGTITANNPGSDFMNSHLTCGEQFNINGFAAVVSRVRERRFPIVDEERGLVYATLFFDHAGLPEVVLPDGSVREIKGFGDAPFCFMIGELFKIKNKVITRVEAVLFEVPYGMPSGWVAVH
ncbi:MAG: hypothetical protein JXR49_07475 [Acidobacteria bacterium]|nr:hypothetical protein [Acidobacteriota bacterium]